MPGELSATSEASVVLLETIPPKSTRDTSTILPLQTACSRHQLETFGDAQEVDESPSVDESDKSM